MEIINVNFLNATTALFTLFSYVFSVFQYEFWVLLKNLWIKHIFDNHNFFVSTPLSLYSIRAPIKEFLDLFLLFFLFFSILFLLFWLETWIIFTFELKFRSFYFYFMSTNIRAGQDVECQLNGFGFYIGTQAIAFVVAFFILVEFDFEFSSDKERKRAINIRENEIKSSEKTKLTF